MDSTVLNSLRRDTHESARARRLDLHPQNARASHAQGNCPRAELPALDLSRLRFLVAEDEDFQREVLTALLHRLGASSVYCADDGASTLRALKDPTRPIDILLLDLAMPGMDGVELIASLGSAMSPVAVIVNSSFGQDFLDTIKLIAQGHEVNVLGVVEKPLTAAKLRPLVALFDAKPAVGT